MATRILFACVGNSARSQMAEAFCRQLGNDVECASAGSKPEPAIPPEIFVVMKEVAIDITQARPKAFADLPDRRFDYLVTMGCDVICPFLPGAREVRWNIPDPHGKDIGEYRRVRDIVRGEVESLLSDLGRLKA